ncbi:adenylyl-sulfate kinase [Nonomuraea africana]|uniref:Adenylyl-sulfate kinase n=1 Tax=Nonomuraea africana TaxID=46171 RepID=A0ABR9KN92_9ACTN|nr:adenylyl-sulfate kinase [Nonomuraea africana]MBE1563495.1 sulfate adenylyltransferase [Nonomuraea africana]
MTANLQWTPDPRELADLELLLSGAFHPLTGFLGHDDLHEVESHGALADGTPWPAPVTLRVPGAQAGDRVTLLDPEGAALAVLTVAESGHDGLVAGPLEALGAVEHGPFARLRRSPEEVRKELAGRPALAVTMRGPLDDLSAQEIIAVAEELEATVLLLPLAYGEGGPALVRAALKAREKLPEDTLVVSVPLAPREDQEIDLELREHVATAYGATEHLAGPEPVTLPGPPHRRGLVVFFTGLSGSGKSTIARGLRDALLELGSRTVTYLDGDVVRHLLSKGLTFSKDDRDLNIRRIGFVATEAARHGGLAICAPIAPYAATRAEVRESVEAVGADFLLVHVSTPLEECERRDRKGLYAKARAGEIPEFTGVSDPYEEPDDADLVIDTTHISIEAAVSRVLDTLRSGGWVR